MPTNITLPEGFSYVGAAVISTSYLLLWQTIKVGKARKASGIDYPRVYAEKAEAEASKEAMIFNCTQRAHQNTLERYPAVLLATVVTGLHRPILAASLCAGWVLSRVRYTIGYSTGEPNNRRTKGGSLSFLLDIALLLSATWTAGEWLEAGL